jgi:hypothetical protein
MNGVPQYTYTSVDGVGVVKSEEWYLNGKRHRTDGPAVQEWMVEDGCRFLAYEEWYLNDQLHRTDGPAYRGQELVYLEDGRSHPEVYVEDWYLKDEMIHPRVLRQPVRTIERWWKAHQARRLKAIEDTLWDSGMVVFPGLMGMLRKC